MYLHSELVFQYTYSHSWLDVVFRFNKLVLSWIFQVISYEGILSRTDTYKTCLWCSLPLWQWTNNSYWETLLQACMHYCCDIFMQAVWKNEKKLHEMVSKALLKAREMMLLSDPPLTLKPVNLCYKEICCWQVHNGLLISLFSSRCLLFPVFSWELKLMGCICNSLMPAFPPCYRQIPWLPFSVFKHFARLLQSSWNTNSFEKSCQFL